MNELLEMKKEINNLLKKMQLPKRIKTTTNNIYKDYEEAYRKLILEIKQRNILDAKELQKFESYVKSDYKEDMQITELVQYEEYEQRRTKIVETIGEIISIISSKEATIITLRVEEPTEKENKTAANIIINTTVSEIQSSAKNIINKLPQKDNDLEQTKIEFQEEIKRIIKDAEQCVPEISEILQTHYHEICEQISEIIEKHNEKFKPNKEIDMAHRREEFAKRISSYEQLGNVEIDNEDEKRTMKEVEELEH